ncbi:MATE family efflux transporter [Parablautia muri]|uniref:MATE family efflux transporter n=1 Tax=Parablautia muri TaxID=2320879 RepID=A0A9X5BFG7_9FIRM|nr:MATE family efflux transporter [Parablautia muri]NBJ93079.1 MATE family efflux transporter [Parablautia muri]
MKEKNDLTQGSVGRNLILFALPYLLSSFMQTFYGMADLFVVGVYNGSKTTTAVSIGSQVMHMLTVIIIGFVMGTTVQIGQCVGARDEKSAADTVGTSTVFFSVFAALVTAALLLCTAPIVKVMLTPGEAVEETKTYLLICFAGVPFIVAYNVISGIFRGTGDSKRPMYFVAAACVTNVVLDFVFIGMCGLGAAGAALGTVCGQAVSVVVSLLVIRRQNLGFRVGRENFRVDREVISRILKVGTPVAMQDGFIQVAFIVITVIANSRGLIVSAAVGIVEKLIGFMFLVPSAFLSAISTITAQNMGANKPQRAKRSLYYSLIITVSWGLLCALYNQFLPHTLVGIFTRDEAVLLAGCEYLRSYAFDCAFAAVHFCFSGYFCGNQKSMVSFIHNIAAIILVRIPGAWLASRFFQDSLYPMGWAAPLGSLLSALICVGFYVYYRKKQKILALTIDEC